MSMGRICACGDKRHDSMSKPRSRGINRAVKRAERLAVIGHCQDGDLGDGTVPALDSPRTLVDG